MARAVDDRLPDTGPARLSLQAHGGIIVTSSLAEAMDLANASAPEHLVVGDEKLAGALRRFGIRWAMVGAGGWATTPSGRITLPTAGAVGARGGLSAADFVRQFTVQRDCAGLRGIGGTAMTLAGAEGLRHTPTRSA